MMLERFSEAVKSPCQKYGTDVTRTSHREFVFSSCYQALENVMDLNLSRKISLQERNGFVNLNGLYHLEEKKINPLLRKH